MNKIYKVIWSKVKHQYVVTSEFAHSCTKSTGSHAGKSAAVLAAFLLTMGIGGMSVQAEDTTVQDTLLAMQLSSGKDKNDAVVVPVSLDTYAETTPADGIQDGEPADVYEQSSLQNGDGFYVKNGEERGTYNSLTKDGLWVGGTSDTTGFHVDNDGNIHTTGNAEIDGSFSAANGNMTVDEDGTTYVHANRSELQVTENQAALRHGDNGIIVNNDGVAVSGEFTADNGLKVGVGGYDSDGNGIYNFEVSEDGSLSAAKGSFTVDADGTTYAHAGQSELQVTNNQTALRHGDNGIIVNNDGVTVSGELTADNGLKVGVGGYDSDGNGIYNFEVSEDGSLSAAKGNFTVDADGTTYAHAGQSELQVTDNQAVLRHGNNGVIVNNDGVAVSGELTADNGLKVGVGGYDSDGNGIYKFEVGEDGSLSAANGKFTVDAEGTMYANAGRSELRVTEDQATLRHADNGITVNNEGVMVVGDLEAGNGAVQVSKEGELWAGNGNFRVTSDGDVYSLNGKSQFQVTDNLVAMQHGANYVMVNADGVAVSGDLKLDGTLDTGDLKAESLDVADGVVKVSKEGELWAGNGNFRVTSDGDVYSLNGKSQFQVTGNLVAMQYGTNYAMVNEDGVAVSGDLTADNGVKAGLIEYDKNGNAIYGTEIGTDGSFSTAKGAFKVEAEGTVTSKNDIYIGSQKEDNKVVTKSQLNSVSDDISAYKNAGIVAGKAATDEAIAIGKNSYAYGSAIALGNQTSVHGTGSIAVGDGSSVTQHNSVAIGRKASVSGAGSVALGAYSSTSEENVITVGRGGSNPIYRRIVNVADGINAHDAATVGQMNTLIFGSTEGKAGLAEGTLLKNKATSLVEGINKNTVAINDMHSLNAEYWDKVNATTTNITDKLSTFASMTSNVNWNALNNVDWSAVSAISEVSTMNLDPSKVEGSREPDKSTGDNGGSEVIDDKGNANYSGNVTVGKDLTVNGDANFKGNATFEKGATMKGELNMSGNKITNVGDGAIEAGSKDAVNGGQLWNVQQDVAANSQAINSLGNRVSDLGDEIDSVGAISAALAGLHPLDYDGTGSKFQISAAMGTYDGTQAAAIGGFYHFNRDVMLSLGGATSFEGDKKTAANIGVTFRVGEGASGKTVSNDILARLEAMDQKIAALEQENKELKNVLGAIDTSLSKEFPDVPANHWAYEAVTKLAGNDVVAGYPDGEFHGDRTMTRYEMAEIIYKAMSKGVQVDQKLVEEFKPEMEQVAANETAQAASAETAQATEANA